MEAIRTALVTGGTRRIGRAITKSLAQAGWTVAIHYNRSGDHAEALAAEIVQDGGSARIFGAELNDPAAVDTLIPTVNQAVGPLTLLVNNASVYLHDTLDELDRDTWDRQFAINLQTPVFLSKAFAAQLPADQTGNIVNMVDQRVWNLTPDMTSYTLTKSALWTATKTLAQSLAPRIRVNAIGPGPTLPNDVEGPEGFEREIQSVPLKQPVGLENFGQAVLFLVNTPVMTGQMLALDSGQHLVWQSPTEPDGSS